MHPSALLLIVLVTVNAARAAANTPPAVQFWEETLPGTPMPPTIAELIQKGTDNSPLKERSLPQLQGGADCFGYSTRCPPASSAAKVATGVFFQQDKVRVGSIMTAYFPPVDLPAILPRDDAEKAPFENVADVLAMFAIAPGSAEESMEYEVAAVAPLDGRRHVTCHDDPFPYAVYRCHVEKKEMSTEAYVLTLRGLQHGGAAASALVDMVAVCHLDTSNWSPAHPAFKTLNLQPGAAPVCHFMPYADLLFSTTRQLTLA